MVLMQFMGLDAKWWAAGGGIALVGVWWWRRNMGGTSTEELPLEDEYAEGDGSAQPGTTSGLYGMFDPVTGIFTGPSGSTQVIATNAQWAQTVLTSMTATFADTYDPATIAIAIAKYLAGKALTDAEYNIAETAIQLFGRPPAPPRDPYKETPQPGQPTGTAPAAPTGLRVLGGKPTYVRIQWNTVPGATEYQWAVPSRAQYGPWSNSTAATISMGGSKPSLKINLAVRARNSKGTSPWSGQISWQLPRA